MKKRKLIIDIETDDLNATVIWCIVTKDIETGNVEVYRKDVGEDFYRFCRDMDSVGTLCGHNILGFDLWVLRSLLDEYGFDFSPYDCIDTLVCSRLFNFGVEGGHSLDAWGKRLGNHKTHFNDWSKLTDEMVEYCIQDVEVTYQLYKFFEPHFKEPWTKALRLEHDIAVICHEMQENGFYFDIDKAKEIHTDLSEQVSNLERELQLAFPPRPVPIRVVTPTTTKSGALARKDFRWVEDGDLTPYTSGAPFTRIEWVPFNPGSPSQVVAILNTSGWEPFEKTKGHANAERELNALRRQGRGTSSEARALEDKLREFAVTGWKISEENLETLPEDAPEGCKLFIKYRMFAKRLQVLDEWFASFSPATHRIHGSFNHIGARTHRMSHSDPNMGNVPSVDSKYHNKEIVKLAETYGKEMRSCWQAEPGKKLVGVDAEGIQLRVLAHYMDDPEFTEALVSGDKAKGTDVHTLNAIRLGLGPDGRPRAKTFNVIGVYKPV